MTGRFKKITRIDHMCELCESGVGNEYHYLLKCNHFKKLHKENASILKMRHLMNNKNIKDLINLAKFVICILDHFKEASFTEQSKNVID